MDTDSAIISPLMTDPFRRARAHSLVYAFRLTGADPEYAVRTLPTVVADYVADHPDLHLADMMAADGNTVTKHDEFLQMWLNNWEIVHLASFRRKEVRDWLEHLWEKHAEGFYKHRWGESEFTLPLNLVGRDNADDLIRRRCSPSSYHVHVLSHRSGSTVLRFQVSASIHRLQQHCSAD